MDFATIGLDVVKGLIVGGGYALFGYFTKARSAGEEFDGYKAVPAILYGTVLGAIAGFMGLDPLDTASAETIAATYIPLTFLVFVLDYVGKGIWNLIRTKILHQTITPTA